MIAVTEKFSIKSENKNVQSIPLKIIQKRNENLVKKHSSFNKKNDEIAKIYQELQKIIESKKGSTFKSFFKLNDIKEKYKIIFGGKIPPKMNKNDLIEKIEKFFENYIFEENNNINNYLIEQKEEYDDDNEEDEEYDDDDDEENEGF